jgi:hypothetical protein
MNRVFFISLGIVLLLLAGSVWVAANSVFLFEHPDAKDMRFVIDHRTGGAVLRPLPPGQAKPVAKAITPEEEYDFGTLDPLTEGEHAFIVRNEGTAPLKLRVGPTTCKCTVSGVEKKELLPGEETKVTMFFNTGRDPEYAHTATIFTTDSARRSLYFTVRGKVRVLIAAEPKELPLPAANPDARLAADVLLHSQLWDDFEVCSVQCGLADMEWRVESVDPEAVPNLTARTVKKLHCEFPYPQGRSQFQDALQVELRPKTGEQLPETLTIPVTGSVIRRLAFYGPAIDSTGLIDMGNIAEGSARQVKLIAKVRDDVRDLGEVKLEVVPEFAVARFEPHPDGQPGMYQLTVEIPAGIEPCQYKSNPLGQVRIHTEHPRIDQVELGLSFAVVPRS